MTNLAQNLNSTRTLLDSCLSEILIVPKDLTAPVVEAMRYATIGGGKAIRPFLVLTVANIFNVPQTEALRIACAVEMVHTYSLIHDDLPAMDNDTLRRGKPTVHIQFDEAIAILTGDALLTKAFEILSAPETNSNPSIRALLIQELTKSIGAQGMIGGQMMDLIGEKTPLNQTQITQMQHMKTGALLRYACLASAWAANAPETHIQALSNYAEAIGILFQITDDILDEEGESQTVGKTLGKDKNAHKSTFISLLGIDKTKEMAHALVQEATRHLAVFNSKASLLEELVFFILNRKK